MPERNDRETGESNRRQLQGLPVIRRNVAGIDLGSERHWVCAATLEGSGREIASFGATTPELLRRLPYAARPALRSCPDGSRQEKTVWECVFPPISREEVVQFAMKPEDGFPHDHKLSP